MRRGNRPKVHVEDAGYALGLTRQVIALGKRVADGDPTGMALFVDLRGALGLAEQHAFDGLKAQGYSLAEIGAALGIPKQEVHRRWGATRQPPKLTAAQAARERERKRTSPAERIAQERYGRAVPRRQGGRHDA